MLRADSLGRFGREMRLKQLKDRTENRQAGKSEVLAFVLEPSDQRLVEQSIEHDARFLLDPCENLVELLVAADRRVHMLDGGDVRVLSPRGARDGHEGLSG